MCIRDRVSAVKIDEAIASRSISNVSSGLSGLVPGLVVNQSTGFTGCLLYTSFFPTCFSREEDTFRKLKCSSQYGEVVTVSSFRTAASAVSYTHLFDHESGYDTTGLASIDERDRYIL